VGTENMMFVTGSEFNACIFFGAAPIMAVLIHKQVATADALVRGGDHFGVRGRTAYRADMGRSTKGNSDTRVPVGMIVQLCLTALSVQLFLEE